MASWEELESAFHCGFLYYMNFKDVVVLLEHRVSMREAVSSIMAQFDDSGPRDTKAGESLKIFRMMK